MATAHADTRSGRVSERVERIREEQELRKQDNQKPDPQVRDDRQLSQMLTALWPDIHRRNVSAIDAGLKIIELRAKLEHRAVIGGTDDGTCRSRKSTPACPSLRGTR